MTTKNILFVFGTRPEVIKLAPVILELKKYKDKYNVIICNTEQQKELSNQTLNYFGLNADINLDCMRPNQSLADVQARIISSLEHEVFEKYKIGETFESENLDDLANVLKNFVDNFEENLPVYKKNLQEANGNFSPANFAKRLEKIILSS